MSDTFYRLCTLSFDDSEQVKYDLKASKISAVEYQGLAPVGAQDTDAVWSIMRIEYDAAGQMTRRRFLPNIKWSERDQGWA